jgi:hypothetical protein
MSDIEVTFDSLLGNGHPAGPIPSVFAGFAWNKDAWFLTSRYVSFLRIPRGIALFNAYGRPVAFKSDRGFGLKGLSASLLWNEQGTLLIQGWSGGAKTCNASVDLRRNASMWSDINFREVDRINLDAQGAHFIVDSIIVQV